MAAAPRILTFNFHEPYLCLMAKTGLRFSVGLFNGPPFARPWQTKFRPIPKNMSLIEEDAWRRELEAGGFDVVIAQNEMNAAQLLQYSAPILLVCHNRRTFLETTFTNGEEGQQNYRDLLARLQERCEFIYISESKRDSYGIPGRVIMPGIDVDDYGGYTGEIAEVLRVGNAMRARDRMFDVDFQERVAEGFAHRVVGEDPGIPKAKPSASFADLLDKYRSLRCLLHVTREEYEDGYNLSTLEALACGMPVVSLGNKTSLITDGVDGYVSYDAEVLRARIRALLDDRDLALEIGAKGREMVARKFPISAFAESWREAINKAAERSPRKTGAAPQPVPKLKMLMQYVASPVTTGRYFEHAAREKHEVITCGFRVPEGVLEMWGFPTAPPDYTPQNIDVLLYTPYADILNRLPEGFEPDLFFWVDSGPKRVVEDIDSVALPKICYLIDTHIAPDPRIDIALHFDYVFIAQKAQLNAFQRAGIHNVQWMPLACAPELYDTEPLERNYDWSYVGRLDDEVSDRRHRLITGLQEKFPSSWVGRAWPHELAAIYSQSKIVVNACIQNDVNMRVFEALASGALLITDEAEGLEDLFEDGTHLVIYRDDDALPGLVEKYLADDEARERIAAAGRACVMAKHTYAHRLETMLRMVLEARGAYGGHAGGARFHTGGYYRSERPELAANVPAGLNRVLDCGCGGGDFGRALKRDRGIREVHGIEVVEQAWQIAKEELDEALLGSIEDMDLPYEAGYFDCVCFGDVLEHLIEPAEALRKAARVLDDDGIMVMSIPNVRYAHVVTMLASGRWKYDDAGILDRTHLRFFTAVEMINLLKEAGLELVRIAPLSALAPDELPLDEHQRLHLGKVVIGPLNPQEYQDFRTYQYLVVAAKPGADLMLKARCSLDVQDYFVAYTLAKGSPRADETERKLLMAKAAGRMGNLTEAESLYRQVLDADASNIAAAAELGILLVARNQAEDAAPYLERSIAAEPGHDRALGALGLVELMRGNKARAMELFTASLEVNFDNESILNHLIATAYELKRLGEIEPLVRRYAEFYPGNLGMCSKYAELLHELGRDEEAIDRLETALIFAPDNQPVLEMLKRLRGEA